MFTGNCLEQIKNVPKLTISDCKRHFLVQEDKPHHAHQQQVQEDGEREQAFGMQDVINTTGMLAHQQVCSPFSFKNAAAAR